MKNFITAFLLLISITSFSQTQYYTTDGKNRITEAEATKSLAEQVAKLTKIFGKQAYGSLTVEETEIINDSIISKITFALSDKKSNKLINYGPLYALKNKEFPVFDLKTLTNENFSSEQLKGKPTMINFWFAKCAPCIDEMPVLNKIAEKYKDDFNFIAITYENEKDVRNFLNKHPFNFKHLVNAKKFINLLGIKAYPMNLFIDKDGVLKYVKGGIPYERIEEGELKMGEGNEIIEILEKLK